ncbi:hypothetical protein J4Q44_G00059020 [Coregonus suidteri]|uniref:Uncharacterized protein n=1 Tax=Coregonus suidteri TaxID=861788 RepID=A0AAN8M2K6_9TELE
MEWTNGPPPKETSVIFSKLPAWATVGIDISPDELLEYFRAQADEKTPGLLYYIDLLSPYLSPLLLIFVIAAAGYHAYRKVQKWKKWSEADSLSKQLHQGLELKESLAARVREAIQRLEALEEAKRAVRAWGRRGRHHHHCGCGSSTRYHEDSQLDTSQRR